MPHRGSGKGVPTNYARSLSERIDGHPQLATRDAKPEVGLGVREKSMYVATLHLLLLTST